MHSTSACAERDGIIAALDEQAGGTWMGMHARSGRFAALTNVRCKTALPPAARSRGQLVLQRLRGSESAGAPDLAAGDFFAYHLVTCENPFADPPAVTREHCVPSTEDSGQQGDQLNAWTRSSASVSTSASEAALVFGSSNEGGGGTAAWPKTSWLQRSAAECVRNVPASALGEEGARQLAERLGACLCASTRFAPEELPDLVRRCHVARCVRSSCVLEQGSSVCFSLSLGTMPVTPRGALLTEPAPTQCFSPLGPSREQVLQNGPFIDSTIPEALEAYGTQAQTIFIRSASGDCLFYFYRNTKGPIAPGPARHLPAPSSDSHPIRFTQQ